MHFDEVNKQIYFKRSEVSEEEFGKDYPIEIWLTDSSGGKTVYQMTIECVKPTFEPVFKAPDQEGEDTIKGW